VKVAIVHDYLNQHGGAENVVEAFHEMFPDAPIFTSIFQPEKLAPSFAAMDVRPSFMQKLPFLDPHFKKYLLLYPRAIESFDLRGYDMILSSSSAFAKGARVPPGACHVSYCYTPMRFVWERSSYLENENIPAVVRVVLPAALGYLKRWDLASSEGVHRFVAISEFIRARVRRAYGRDADVIYPPVDVENFKPSAAVDDYFLVVSRLNPYKKIDVVIDAFNRNGRRLLIAGTGPHEAALKRQARKNVEFLGRVPRESLAGYFSRCRAFIFPGVEDFGIAPVEAMAAGRPVAAYAGGGALETVEDGVTGVFFNAPTPEALQEALDRLERLDFDPRRARARAEQFSKDVFKKNILACLRATRAACGRHGGVPTGPALTRSER